MNQSDTGIASRMTQMTIRQSADASSSSWPSALSCAWNVGLLSLGMMFGHQCSSNRETYLRQCYVACVSFIAIAWILSWIYHTFCPAVAKNRPEVVPSSCETSTAPEQEGSIDSKSSLNDSVAEAATYPVGAFSINSCRRYRDEKNLLEAVISGHKLFASKEDVAHLTVRDVTTIFRYTLEVNRRGLGKMRFLSSLSTRAAKVIASVDVAVSASSGSTVEARQVSEPTTTTNASGQIDTLYFLAAVRIFADWRCDRFVPDGYRRYAMSVSLGRRDLVQNIAKVERAVHAWIRVKRVKTTSPNVDSSSNSGSDQSLVSPTMEELLQHEIETQIHKSLPTVIEESAANGLLWITRQLMYHANMVRKSLQVPSIYPTTREAVETAYEEVYGSYHGWTTQQIFRRSLQGAPEFCEILKLLEEDTRNENLTPTRLFESVVTTPVRHNSSIQTVQPVSSPNPPSAIESLVENFRMEWSKAATHLSRFNCQGASTPRSKPSGPLVVDFDLCQKEISPTLFSFSAPPMRTESDVSEDSSHTEELTASSSDSDDSGPVSLLEQDFVDHGTELTAVLSGLHDLISANNMNDPGKV